MTPSIRIAYADDHVVMRKGICELLSSLGGCQVVIEADNGQELLDQLATTGTTIDVCILDLFMPQLNGFETLAAIRTRWPQMRVLIFTGHYTDYFLIKAIIAGTNGYLLKTCSPTELARAVQEIHRHGMYHSDLMTLGFFRSVMKNQIKLPHFSEKETELLKFCCSDSSYVQIASQMGISAKSVDWYRECLFKKLHVASRSGLVMCAIQLGLAPVQGGASTPHIIAAD